MDHARVLGTCIQWLVPALLTLPVSAATTDFRVEVLLSKQAASAPLAVSCVEGCDWTDRTFVCEERETDCRVLIAGRSDVTPSTALPPVPVRALSDSVCLGMRMTSAEIEPAHGSRRHEGSPIRRGLVVVDILPASPAELAGFQVGDVLIDFGSIPAQTSQDVYDIVQAMAAGEAFDATLERKGVAVQVSGVLGLRTTVGGCSTADQLARIPAATPEDLKPLPFKFAFRLPAGSGVQLQCLVGCEWGGGMSPCKGMEVGPDGPRVADCAVTIRADENGMTPGPND